MLHIILNLLISYIIFTAYDAVDKYFERKDKENKKKWKEREEKDLLFMEKRKRSSARFQNLIKEVQKELNK